MTRQCQTCNRPTRRGRNKFCSHECYMQTRRGIERQPLADRFWSKVQRGQGDACWPWMASRHKTGYGGFMFGGRCTKAHRLAWELTNGPIPYGLNVCHHCDNPPCVNPAHLFLGTDADNNADKWNKGRGRTVIGRWRQLHPPRGETNGRAKLTSEQVTEIKSRYAAGGVTQEQLWTEYSISRAQLQRILHGKAWHTIEEALAL